jgi:hypothetical protein
MWKFNISLILVAVVAISISRRMRLSPKYERSDRKVREISDWNSLDRGIDPTIQDGEK